MYCSCSHSGQYSPAAGVGLAAACVGVAVAVLVDVGSAVGVLVGVGVFVAVLVGANVTVGVAVDEGVSVGVGSNIHSHTTTPGLSVVCSCTFPGEQSITPVLLACADAVVLFDTPRADALKIMAQIRSNTPPKILDTVLYFIILLSILLSFYCGVAAATRLLFP